MEIIIMKKIIIFTFLTILFTNSPAVYSACSLENIEAKGSCTAIVGTPEPTLQERLVPNNLNQLVNPNKDSFAAPTAKQYAAPESVNMNPAKKEAPQEPQYDANCQFGVCLPGQSGVVRE